MHIKIVGSGSAGNHMAYALQKFVKKITLTDLSLKALKRSKVKIYIPRYKVWNKKISQIIEGDDKNKSYDAIVIASPPSSHLDIIKKNINKSDIFLIEKPLCEPNKKTINSFEKIINKYKKKLFYVGIIIGYFHQQPYLKKYLN